MSSSLKILLFYYFKQFLLSLVILISLIKSVNAYAVTGTNCIQLFKKSELSTAEKYLISLGYPTSVSQRITKIKPTWINKLKKYLFKNPEYISQTEDWLIQYRGLDIGSLKEYDYLNKEIFNSLASYGEVWMSSDLQTAAKYGKYIFAYAVVPFLQVKSNGEGIALSRKEWPDDRILLIKVGVLKKESQNKHVNSLFESDFEWRTYEDLVKSKEMPPIEKI